MFLPYKFRVFFYLACWFISFLQAVNAQDLHSFSYTVEQGLPSSEVYDIIQDQKGYIWVATDRGVSCFDGYRFRNFTSEDGLLNNTIFNLYEDWQGRIWFFGFGHKLCYFDMDTVRPYKFNHVLGQQVSMNQFARSFHLAGDGTFTFGYLSGGIFSISADGKFTRKSFGSAHVTRSYIVEEIGETFVYGTYAGSDSVPGNSLHSEFIFSGPTGLKSHAYKIPYRRNTYTGFKRKNGTYIFYAPGKVFEVDKDGRIEEVSVGDKDIMRFYEDRDSCLWVSVKNEGARRYGPNKSFTYDRYERFFPSKNITCFLEDNERGFWVATLQEGLLYVPSLNYRSYLYNGNTAESDIGAITGDGKQTIYLGANRGDYYSITCTDPGLAGTPVKLAAADPFVFAMFYDKATSVLWAGTSKQPAILPGQQVKIVASSGRKFCKVPSSGNIWLSKVYTVCESPACCPGEIQDEIRSPVRIDAIFIDRDGRRWIGGLSGLYTVMNKVIEPYLPGNSLLRSRIMEINQLPDGRMVLASLGQGILILDGEKVQQVSVKQGLSSSIVNSIALDGFSIWAATNKGVNRIILKQGTVDIRKYSAVHGLPTNDIRQIYFQSGNVWLATKSGAAVFKANAISYNTVPPPVYISNVYFNDRLVNPYPDNPVSLNYTQDVLRVEFVGLSYRWRGNVLYRYRLRGLNEDWQYSDNTSVQFTSLDPGEYKFEVSASNEDGVWNESPACFSFVIHPPFWQTWWFRIIALTILFSVVWAFFYFRYRRLRQQSELMVQIANYRQQALSAQMNPHFMFNSLNSIQNFILQEQKRKAVSYLSKFARLMRITLENSRQEYVPLEDELQSIDFYLELEALRFRDKFAYRVTTETGLDTRAFRVPPLLIQPFVENAVRHGLVHLQSEEGFVRVKVGFEGENLMCTVEDNGIGREQAEKLSTNPEAHKSAGSEITVHRLQLLCRNNNQDFVFYITDGKTGEGRACGTIVKFALPFRTNGKPNQA